MSSFNRNREAEQTIEVLLKLARYVEPLEHVTGRIKMRVPLANLVSVIALLNEVDVEKGVQSIPGLKGYELNPWLRCATIRYDPNVLSSDLWDGLCSMKENPSTEKLIRSMLIAVFQRRLAQASE